jgi:hypothetical protein
MKRLGKVFWGVLCMILLFAFSHASAGDICAPNTEVVKTKEKVQFEWDAVTTYNDKGKTRIEKGKFVKYLVYRYKAENKDENPPTKKVKDLDENFKDLYKEIESDGLKRYLPNARTSITQV